MKILRKLIVKKEGVTAIEFAILAPVFFLLFLGIIEVGLTVFLDSSLNTGVRDVARKGVTNGYNNRTEVEDILRRHLSGMYDDDRLTIVVRAVEAQKDNPESELLDLQQISDAITADPDAFFNGGGFSPALNQSGAITVYAVRYRWGGFSSLVAPFLPDNLFAISVVRNEEF